MHLGAKTLAQTVADARPGLLSIVGVAKVDRGICGGDSCIKVFVTKKTSVLVAQIPPMIGTWQVDVVEVPK